MTTPFNPEHGTEHYENENNRSVFDQPEVPTVGHSGNLPEEMRETPGEEFGPINNAKDASGNSLLTTPDDPSTMPDTLKEHFNQPSVIPPKENRDSKLLPWYKKPMVKIAAAALAISAAFGGGAIAFGGGEDEPQDSPSEVSTDDNPAEPENEPVVHDTIEDKESTPVNQVDSETQNLKPSLIEGDGGFLIPSEKPDVYTAATAPELKQPANMSEAFEQISNILTYTAATGDGSYLKYIVASPDSELGRGFLDNYENVSYYEDVRGFTDFQSWRRISAIYKADENLPLGKVGESVELPVHGTVVAYDSFYEEYGPMYQMQTTQDAHLKFVQFDQAGSTGNEPLILPVFESLSEYKDLVIVDPGDLLNEDGSPNSKY